MDGVAVLTFDGGAAKRLGTGGFTVWLPSGRLIAARALWFGSECSTNNEAELATLKAGLQWIAAHFPDHDWGGELLVMGDSNIVIGFMNRQFRPQRKFVPEVLACQELVKSFKLRTQYRHVYR